MNNDQLNVILNILGVLLGGTALGVILRFMTNRHKLRNEDVADIRDHYAKAVENYAAEIAALRESNRKLEQHFRDMIDDIDKKHAEERKADREAYERDNKMWEERWRRSEEDHDTCKKERSELRAEIEGLKRQMAAQAAERVIALGDVAAKHAPHAAASAPRVKKIVENNGK